MQIIFKILYIATILHVSTFATLLNDHNNERRLSECMSASASTYEKTECENKNCMWSDSDNTCSVPPPFDWCDGNALRNPYDDEKLNTDPQMPDDKFSAPGNVDSGFGYQPVCYLNAPEQNCRGKPYRFNIQGRAPGISNTPIASPFMCVAQTAFKFRWSQQQAQEENGGSIEEDNWSKKWTNFHTHLVDLTGDDKLDLVITYTPVYEHKPDEQPAQGVPPRRIRAWKNTGTNSVPIYQVPLEYKRPDDLDVGQISGIRWGIVKPTHDLMQECIDQASKTNEVEAVLIFAGTTSEWETEGCEKQIRVYRRKSE